MFEIEDSKEKPASPRHRRIPPEGARPADFELPKADWRSNLPRASTYGCLVFAVLSIFAWLHRDSLPTSPKIDQRSLQEPVQTEIEEEPFTFAFGGRNYVVQPLASYQISGLIVEHNNPQGWGDIYHDNNSVDFRDLCIVWGDNLKENVHTHVTYWHETWTCWWKQVSEAAQNLFSGERISNNHLLSDNEQARNIILSARIGDQIAIQGMLVNYWIESEPSLVRRSSLVRSDSGDGACEVIFVQSAEIIKRANLGWRRFFLVCRNLLLICLAVKLALFLFMPLRLYTKSG